jgi:hypothetical protein
MQAATRVALPIASNAVVLRLVWDTANPGQFKTLPEQIDVCGAAEGGYTGPD